MIDRGVSDGSAPSSTGRPRSGHTRWRVAGCSARCGHWSTVPDRVCRNQRQRPEDQAEDEEADEAVALAVGDTRRPERNGNPDDRQDDPQDGPHSDPHMSRWTHALRPIVPPYPASAVQRARAPPVRRYRVRPCRLDGLGPEESAGDHATVAPATSGVGHPRGLPVRRGQGLVFDSSRTC